MKELREVDINGAPLLFLAASSRTTDTCFQEVLHVVRAFLGMGGLLEQFETHDYKGRNILMYAARGKNKEIFQYVRALDKEIFVSPRRFAEQRPSAHIGLTGVVDERNSRPDDEACCNPVSFVRARCLRQDISKRTYKETMVVRSSEEWFDRVTKVDFSGKTMLHHAAEAASPAVLNQVFTLTNEEGNRNAVKQRMVLPDKNGRTPIMLFLRNKSGSYNKKDDAVAKMNILWLHSGKGWLKKREVPPVWKIKSDGQEEVASEKFITVGRTELFHAAHGGPVTLDLLLQTIRRRHKKDFCVEDGKVVVLDNILGMAVQSDKTPDGDGLHEHSTTHLKEHNKWFARLHQTISVDTCQEERNQNARNWGYGMLLAAAVKGGHVEVIKRVVMAIEASSNKEQIRSGRHCTDIQYSLCSVQR